jgi:membrane protease YdiL (CAAX protease family)
MPTGTELVTADRPTGTAAGRGVGRRFGAIVTGFVVPTACGGVAALAAAALGAPGGLSDALFYATTIVAVVLCSHRSPSRLLALRRPAAVALALGALAGCARSALWLGTLPTRPAAPTSSALALAVLAQVVLVALGEELLFRGLVLTRLLELCGPAWSIAASTTLFALLHLHDASFVLLPTYLADGVLLAALRLRASSIWPAVLVHAVFNATTVAWPVLVSVSNLAVYRYEAGVVVLDAMLACWLLAGRWCPLRPLGTADASLPPASGPVRATGATR